MVLFHIGGSTQVGNIILLREIKPRLLHEYAKFGGLFPLPPGRRGIFQDAGDLRITEIQLQQRMHHPDRLRIAFKVAEILADHGVELIKGFTLCFSFHAGHQRIHQLG